MFKRHGLTRRSDAGTAKRHADEPGIKQKLADKMEIKPEEIVPNTEMITHDSSPEARWIFVETLLLPRAVHFTGPAVRNWQTVRLYISSTFSDFNSEREILVKDTMPMLRMWAEKSKLRLVDLDLRWGLPRNLKTEESIQSILDAIQR